MYVMPVLSQQLILWSRVHGIFEPSIPCRIFLGPTTSLRYMHLLSYLSEFGAWTLLGRVLELFGLGFFYCSTLCHQYCNVKMLAERCSFVAKCSPCQMIFPEGAFPLAREATLREKQPTFLIVRPIFCELELVVGYNMGIIIIYTQNCTLVKKHVATR
jgi:hypothetical protein